MPAPLAIPLSFRSGPFRQAIFLAAGFSEKVLRGRRFTRLFPRVWVWAKHVMTHLDWIIAAGLALPDDARMTGITRLQHLGLDVGPRRPYHFVVARDLHLVIEKIMLHRTEVMPPCDDDGVTPAAAFIACCDEARVIDAIQVGDWLLFNGHMTLLELRELIQRDPWRDGAAEALWVSRHLNGRARSLPESETRAVLVFAGLPVPEVNKDIVVNGAVVACGDLVWLAFWFVVEYEGGHHQMERLQYLTDIDRYTIFRDIGLDYEQVTKESKAKPRTLVSIIYRKLVENGYRGPAPDFGPRYLPLFAPSRLRCVQSEVAWRPHERRDWTLTHRHRARVDATSPPMRWGGRQPTASGGSLAGRGPTCGRGPCGCGRRRRAPACGCGPRSG